MGKDQSDYKEVPYEGYGPHGIAIFVDALTDNTTRTVGDVRSVFNKFNGNLGTQGSLSFLFDHKCVFTFKAPADTDMEELILELIDYGVDDEFDVDDETGEITIYGEPNHFGEIQKHLEEAGYEITSAEFTRIPNDLKEVTPDVREVIDKMVDLPGGLRGRAERLYQHEARRGGVRKQNRRPSWGGAAENRDNPKSFLSKLSDRETWDCFFRREGFDR